MGVLIAYFFLDPVPDELQDAIKDKSTVWKETLELATATIRMNFKLEQVLLIPFIMVPGMDFAFYYADWPAVSLPLLYTGLFL